MKIKCELEQVTQLKTKGKAVFTFNRQLAGHFTNFADKPLTIEILVDGEEQKERLTMISHDQRRKIYAVLKDIANHVGDNAESMKDNLKALYCYDYEIAKFSLADCSKELATDFIEWLIQWSFQNGVPLSDKPINYFDDIERYHQACIQNLLCAVCGRQGEVHHVDAIGMGRDRTKVDDSKYQKVCLCREHHSEAHQAGWNTFVSKYHL